MQYPYFSFELSTDALEGSVRISGMSKEHVIPLSIPLVCLMRVFESARYCEKTLGKKEGKKKTAAFFNHLCLQSGNIQLNQREQFPGRKFSGLFFVTYQLATSMSLLQTLHRINLP